MLRSRLAPPVIAVTVMIVLWSVRAQDVSPALNSAQPPEEAIPRYLGSGSCSAVACHGGIAPLAGADVLRNEHTTWMSDDRHSRSFQVLFDERSKKIARNLAGEKAPLPAEQDARCLGCHTTPRPEPVSRETAWMNQDGVGCESCHGSARNWLGPHTTVGWKDISAADKQKTGFANTKDLVNRVELCTGCHVGQGARTGVPSRDVNHDLIAAGHPRLNFEFAAYQENMPKHWRLDKAEAPESSADFPARAWALGQLVSARAALNLLGERSAGVAATPVPKPPALPGPGSTENPWPEFAEYGCFSCHHGLADEPWRKARATAGKPPGDLAWGTWYFPLTSALLDNAGGDGNGPIEAFQSALKRLAGEMSRPVPDAAAIKPITAIGIKALDDLIREFATNSAPSRPLGAVEVVRLIEALNRPDAWNKVASWDHAAQRYLALVALNQARAPVDERQKADQKALSDELHKLLQRLAFPPDYESPKGFDPRRLNIDR